MSKSGLVKCRKVTTRERAVEGGEIVRKKQTMYQWVRAEIARSKEMLKSLGLELA